MATRADNRDGSCRQMISGKHSGKWRVQFTQVDNLGRRKRLSRIFTQKTQAKSFLQGLRHGARVETARRGRELTLAEWFDWLVEHDWPESLDDKTIGIRQGRFDKYVRPEIGDVPLAKLDPLAVRSFYRELREAGIGEPTVHAVKANLVRVFNQAITPYQRVPMTHANPFRLTLQSVPLRSGVALTPEQAQKAIFCEILNVKERVMLATFLLAGLRLSEQMALTRSQLLFDQNLITVDRAVKLDRKGGQSIGLPKGDKRRLAVMCPTLKTFLCELAGELGPSDHLWPAEGKDQPRMKRSVYRTWKTIIEKADLPDDMSPHDCRLTHINWIEKLLPDVSGTTLKEHIGHASGATVTEINYTRPITPAQQLLRKGLERLISPMKESRKSDQKKKERRAGYVNSARRINPIS